MAKIQAYPIAKAAGVARECNDYDGQTSPPDIDELSHTLRQSRAEVDDHDCRREVGLGISAGHSGDRTFVKSKYAVYIRSRVELVEEVGLARARVVEDIFDA